MNSTALASLLQDFLSLPKETEWVEFKHNNFDPSEVGEYLSALANSAGLHKKDFGYIVWGIENETNRVVGTSFKPRQQKVNGQELECWLAMNLSPRIDFKIYEFLYKRLPIVLLQIQPCQHTPVRFKETEFLRIGSYKKKLKEFPEKERALWAQLSSVPFEKGLAARGISADKVLSLLDYSGYLELTGQNLPSNKSGILERLSQEKIIIKKGAD